MASKLNGMKAEQAAKECKILKQQAAGPEMKGQHPDVGAACQAIRKGRHNLPEFGA